MNSFGSRPEPEGNSNASLAVVECHECNLTRLRGGFEQVGGDELGKILQSPGVVIAAHFIKGNGGYHGRVNVGTTHTH